MRLRDAMEEGSSVGRIIEEEGRERDLEADRRLHSMHDESGNREKNQEDQYDAFTAGPSLLMNYQRGKV